MKDSEGNIIPPCEFIPVAEKVGLIDKVDGMVFRKAAMFFGELIQKTDIKIVLSINASVRHLMKSEFLDEIRNLLESNRIPADQLETLKDIGCDYIQGYIWGRPLSAEDAEKLVAGN